MKKIDPETTAGVDAFLATLEHPHKAIVVALRGLIRDAAPGITEGVKWNAPSFRTREWFATTHLRTKQGVAIIFHAGAKARSEPIAVDDPDGLLEWLGKDRARVVFTSLDDLRSREVAFRDLVRRWVAAL
jgi:hypothetical protein